MHSCHAFCAKNTLNCTFSMVLKTIIKFSIKKKRELIGTSQASYTNTNTDMDYIKT
jgi:hypothetical protein